jgi:UPF0716 protein FxsA
MPYLLLIILLAPLLEIWFIIQVGAVIGGIWTLFAIVATALIGMAIIRIQGVEVLLRARQRIERDETPIIEVLEGILLALAGLFLLIPGFITDALGFLLLTPLRKLLIRSAAARMEVHRYSYRSRYSSGEVFEGEYSRSDAGNPSKGSEHISSIEKK